LPKSSDYIRLYAIKVEFVRDPELGESGSQPLKINFSVM